MSVSFLESIKLFCLYFVELSVLFVAVQMLIALIQQKYQNLFKNHLQKDSYSSYIKSILLGALTPFCSCSTIPLLRALLKANVAFGVCIAYLFTSPLIKSYHCCNVIFSFWI
ncbi:permease [uncultured Helicobacter sp.]|uniref:permease n=1 Tax=uncultured Helicobacter sp. TaxID=175537 RepID=UPI003751A707